MSYTENGSMINNEISTEFELNENSENYSYTHKLESQKFFSPINEKKISTEDKQSLNENSESSNYEYKSESQKSIPGINKMKTIMENEQSLNENSESYSYEYKSESQKSSSPINEIKISSEDKQSLNENSESSNYEYKSESQKSIPQINKIKTITEDEQSLNENSESYSYEYKSDSQKSSSSINEMKISTEDEQSLNENSGSYIYEYMSESQKSISPIDEMKISSEDEQSLNENSENYSYEYKSESQKSSSPINEMKISTEDKQSLNENSGSYSYNHKSESQKSISSLNEITINSEDRKSVLTAGTVGKNAKLSSNTHDPSSIQEDQEIELYLQKLQTSSMHKNSEDTTKTSIGKSDRSRTSDGRLKTSANTVQADLKQLLLDLCTGYLMEGAVDIVDYGVEYFERLKRCRGAWPSGYGCAKDHAYDGGGGLSADDEAWPERSDCVTRTPQSSGGDGIVVDDEDADEHGRQERTFTKSDEQRRVLVASVRDMLAFGALDVDQMTDALVDAMFEREVRAREVIIEQGDDMMSGGHFYVVGSGTYVARIADRVVRTYAGTGSFGELALMHDMPHDAAATVTVEAVTDGALWVLDRRTFDRVVRRTETARRHTFDRFMRSVPALNALEPRDRADLTDALVTRHHVPGDLIAGPEDPSDGTYFVLRGTVTVHVADRTGARVHHVRTIREGGHFGELVPPADCNGHSCDAAASVYYADGHVKLAFLGHDVFERILGPRARTPAKRNHESGTNKCWPTTNTQ